MLICPLYTRGLTTHLWVASLRRQSPSGWVHVNPSSGLTLSPPGLRIALYSTDAPILYYLALWFPNFTTFVRLCSLPVVLSPLCEPFSLIKPLTPRSQAYTNMLCLLKISRVLVGKIAEDDFFFTNELLERLRSILVFILYDRSLVLTE